MTKYKIVLDIAGKKYTDEGETIEEALTKMALDWMQIKNKGIMIISHGKTSLEKIFYMHQLRRIFVNKITRMMWGKRLQLLMCEKETAGLND